MKIRRREPVVLAASFAPLVDWYRDVLGFRVTKRFDDKFHYCNLETDGGVTLGIASAAEMGVEPADRGNNTVVLQFEVDDVKELLARVEAGGGRILNGPAFDPDGSFWFGSFADPEGNPFWVVDGNCP